MARRSSGGRDRSPILRRSLSEKEQELQTALDEILRKNKPALGAVLERIYGLAGPFPSPFAVEVVSRLGLTEACPLLMRTYLTVHENVKASPEYKNVADAVEKLGCEESASPQPAVSVKRHARCR